METYFKELEAYLKSVLGHLKKNLQGIRTNRPTTELLEDLKVEYAGEFLAIKQLGALSVKPPREINVTVWDQAAIPGVTKALQEASLGLSVSNDGNVIRASLPPLTEERRMEFTKLVKKMAEETRIKIRTHRDDIQKKMKGAESRKEFNEDQLFKGKERMQKMVDEINKEVENLVQDKLKELRD